MKFSNFSLVFSVVFSGYQSATCEQKVNPCSSDPCHNNATCYPQGPGPRGFGCSCPAGFTGPTCAQLVNFCALNPCAHGVCRSVGDNYRCLCVPGELHCHGSDNKRPCCASPCVCLDVCVCGCLISSTKIQILVAK